MTTLTNLKRRYLEYLHMDSDIVEHLPTFVDWVDRLEANTVIELGVRYGISTVAFLHALSSRGGMLYSVDTSPCPFLGAMPGWQFLLGDDTDPVIVAQLPADADIVFIDTSHEYEHTLAELDLYHQRVRPGGVILLHDTEVAAPDYVGDAVPFPVRTAIEEFTKAHGYDWENVPNCYGLGTIHIPG